MLEKYMENEYIRKMLISIEKFNTNAEFKIEDINNVIRNFLNRTMIFISVYGIGDIRDKVIYCINFIIDKCLDSIDNNTKNQLYELIISINAYPLISKILPVSNISENYVETLKINLRKYGNYYYTDKQIELFSKIYLQDKDIVFSAPTSYGKTHLSLMTILDMISNSVIKNVLIIVPTKALINEYRKTVNKLNKDNLLNIFESPYIHPDFNEKNIFIYTQERTLVAVDYIGLNNKIDFVLIDEAQVLADVLNDRTLLLIKALNYFKNTPKIYLAPFVQHIYENVISKLVDSSNEQFSMELDASDSVVSNNKYVIDITIPNKVIWYNATFAKNDSELVKIKEYETDRLNLSNNSDTYSDAIDIVFDLYDNLINKNEKSIIYIASRTESMNVSYNIYKRLEDRKEEPPPRVKALIEHIKNNIHDKFLMLNFINRGLAYHNAYLDSYTKRQLEYIIGSNDNYLDKLVCTNTIESGVNLSAKNIFVLIKRSLQGNQPEIKYANLLGRAARLSSNTQGNLFYIKMTNNSKYEKEFYKSSKTKNIVPTKVTMDALEKESNVTYCSFLEDKDVENEQKRDFLVNNNFKSEFDKITNGEITLTTRTSNGLDYYIDINTIIRSENIILKMPHEQIDKYLNCLGNYNDTKEFIQFLSLCYDWEHTCNSKIKNRMKDVNLISTMITYLVQGRSIKDIVNNRIEKMDKGEYKLYVYPENNYIKKLRVDEINYDSNYVLFDKNDLNHLNSLIINSLDQTQNLIEFHVKKYIQDFYYRVRKLHGNDYENKDIGNFLEFSSVDDKKIILIENGIVDNFALNEFSKIEYLKFYKDRKVDLEKMLSYVENKYTKESPYYYAIKDIIS